MLVLSLDTTTRAGSAAVARDGEVLDALAGDPSSLHAERVPADVLRLLERSGLGLPEIDVFAVAAGPGSFTGLRIGIAAMQGFGFATGRPVIGVSTLEALAAAAPGVRAGQPMPRIGVWMDAQRGEIYSALYRTNARATPAALELLDGPSIGEPAATAGRWRSFAEGEWFPVIGDGAVRYRDALCDVAGRPVAIIEPPMLAPTIAVLAWRRALAGERPLPHAIRPLYIRRPDAELARDRRRARA